MHLLVEMPRHRSNTEAVALQKKPKHTVVLLEKEYFCVALLKRAGRRNRVICKWPHRCMKKRRLIRIRCTKRKTRRQMRWTGEGKKKSDIYFSFSVHSVRVPVAPHDKEWSRFRLMACLRCSMKSAQMLRAEKMTLLTSSVSFLSTGETPGPYHYTDTPTEPYHADENLSPLNLIKVFSVVSCSNYLSPPVLDCPSVPP